MSGPPEPPQPDGRAELERAVSVDKRRTGRHILVGIPIAIPVVVIIVVAGVVGGTAATLASRKRR